MTNLIARSIARFRKISLVSIIRLSVYPFTALLTTPIRLGQTLWNSRVLADGQWEGYNRFTAANGINSLTYWTMALNLYKYGRRGESPHVGLGNRKMSNWFPYTLPSLYAYWKLSPLVPLSGMFGWWMAHAIWAERVDALFLSIVMLLVLISTTFYANIFVRQNYNALGWIFFPVGLYGLITGNWLLSALAWLAASFASITVVFIGGIFALVLSGLNASLIPIFSIIPAGLKLLGHLYPVVLDGIWKDSAVRVLKSIGLMRGKSKYRRTQHILNIYLLYYAFLYIQFFIAHYWLTGEYSQLFLAGIIIFLLNESAIARFADSQSIQVFIASLAIIVIIQSQNFWLLPFFWLLISPIPRLTGLPSAELVFDIVPRYAPFSVKELISAMKEFLSPVQSGERIFMAFENPKGNYDNVFDGYRTLLELPCYVASTKEIHYFPDWWAVYKLNYEGAPDFWGRDLASVQKNLKEWKADYLVIYQESGTELNHQWEEAGFETLNKFSWADYEEELRGEKPYSGATPDWWLLKKQ